MDITFEDRQYKDEDKEATKEFIPNGEIKERTINILSDTLRETIEDRFRERCNALGLKIGSKKFKEEQASYFAGVMTTLLSTGIIKELPPYWTIAIISGRSIIEK